MSIPSEPWTTPCGGHPWQTEYLRFRELELRLTDEDASGWAFLVLLSAAAKGQHVFDRELRKYLILRLSNPDKLPDPPDNLVTQLRSIAQIRSSYDPDPPGFVFDNVYHLAFHQLTDWRHYSSPIPPAPECTRLYRGQRNHNWDVGAKIYRELLDGPEGKRQLRARATRACQLGRAIASRLGCSFAHAIAVVQHYSAEDILGVPTWLVDFTRDPWVALFFASDNGQTGDFGIVWDVVPREWTSHTAGEGNPIGVLQLVVPHDIPRIDNQKGVFLVAGLPQFFDQYVAVGWNRRFRQYTGLRFEDPVLEITEQTIYPANDPLGKVLAEVRSEFVDCGCGSGVGPCHVPPEVFTDPLDPKTYEALLKSWLIDLQAKGANTFEPLGVHEAVAVLARFHARLQSPAYASRLPDIVSRSFNRLHDALNALYRQSPWGEAVTFRDAVRQSYINQVLSDKDHVAVLQEALDEIEP